MEVQVNPFDDDIVEDPRNVKNSVSDLNKKPLKKLLDNFKVLSQVISDEHTQNKPRLAHASLIISAEPGNGKSHLIGRLFHELNEKSTLVNIRPFENVSTCWKYVLLKIVQELGFPDKLDTNNHDKELPSQLEVFSHGILSNLLSKIDNNEFNQADAEENNDIIKEDVDLPAFWDDAKIINRIHSNLDKLVSLFVTQLKNRGIMLNASPLSWIKVLLNYTYNRSEINIREICLEWLKGECIEPDEAKMIGIRTKDVSSTDMIGDEINELCKLRILDFCHLAAFFRPFIFCFDQTENYSKSLELVRTFGIVIQSLVDTCPNQMTVVTANQTPWSNSLSLHLEEAHLQRFGMPLELEGINKEQAKELIIQRLSTFKCEGNVAQDFAESDWLSNLFKDKPQIGIRRFIKTCRNQWENEESSEINSCDDQWENEKNSKIKNDSIENYFKKNVKEIKAQPKCQIFDPDILYWVVFEAASCLKGITVKKHETDKGYFSIQWLLDNRSILFGFESSANSIKWRFITMEAKRYSVAKKGLKTVMLRTFELPVIPKSSWKKIGPEIEMAKKKYLDIIQLSKENVVDIYAANQFYREAVEGDIPYSKDEVLEFVGKRLKWLWDRIINGPHVQNEKVESNTNNSCMENIINEITINIKREKLLNVDELLKNLSEPFDKEQILDLCKNIPQIKIHNSPKICLLQWQSNQ